MYFTLKYFKISVLLNLNFHTKCRCYIDTCNIRLIFKKQMINFLSHYSIIVTLSRSLRQPKMESFIRRLEIFKLTLNGNITNYTILDA